MPAIQWSADGMVVRRRGGRSGRGGDLRLRGGSGRGRLGGCAVDVHPPAGIRRPRGGRVPAWRASRIAHGVGSQRRAAVPVAVLPVAHDRVPHLRSRQLAVPERVRHDPHELRHGHPDDRRGRGHVGAAGVAGADARASQACELRHGARRNPLAGRLRRRDVGPLRTRAVALGAGRRDRGADRRPRADLDRVRQRGRPRRDGDLAHRASAGTRRRTRSSARTDRRGCSSGCSSSHPGRRGDRRR